MWERIAPHNLSPEEMIAYTPEWTGERFDDGRPRVPDAILERLQAVTITQAWGVLENEGYHWQTEGGFQCTHPGGTLVGRAVTAQFAPRRPDLRKVVDEKGKRLGLNGDHIHWPINVLVKGDVYVADVFGKIERGPVIGDNLSTSIWAKTGKGVVHNAAVRDIDGIQELPDFVSFVRGFHATYASPTIMLLGLNTPMRIGLVTIMPGDVVLGKGDTVIFIPPQLAEKVVKISELVRLRDVFGKASLATGTYTPGQIDAKWSDEIEKDFSHWMEAHMDELPVSRDAIQELLKERTW